MAGDGSGNWRSVALAVGAAAFSTVLGLGLLFTYFLIALAYDKYPRINCLKEDTPALMWALGLLILAATAAAPLGATYLGARKWELDVRRALVLTAFLLVPVLVGGLFLIGPLNESAISNNCSY